MAAERIRVVSQALELAARSARENGVLAEFDEFLAAIDEQIDVFNSSFESA